jgi:hypothetical protein
MPVLHALPEAAKLLGGISVWTLRKHVFRGNVAVTRIGRRVFVPSEEIERIRREGLPSSGVQDHGGDAVQLKSNLEEQESCQNK